MPWPAQPDNVLCAAPRRRATLANWAGEEAWSLTASDTTARATARAAYRAWSSNRDNTDDRAGHAHADDAGGPARRRLVSCYRERNRVRKLAAITRDPDDDVVTAGWFVAKAVAVEPEPPAMARIWNPINWQGTLATAIPHRGFRRLAFSAWYRREHRGARMPLETDRSCPATAQRRAAQAVTVTAMEPSFADQLARPRAVVIDPAAASLGPGSRAGAQSLLRAWSCRRRKGVPPAQPAMPEGMVIAPGIELPADDPLADYLMEVAGPVGIHGLEFDWPARRCSRTLRSAGHPADADRFCHEPGSGQRQSCDRRASDASGEPG